MCCGFAEISYAFQFGKDLNFQKIKSSKNLSDTEK